MGRKRTQRDAAAALDHAQEIIYSAWEARTAKRRVEIAKNALEISPLCADAYCLLAEHAKAGSDEELDLWRHGVEAGAAAIGKAAFEELEGEFWGFLETRPYMRARSGLALALWERGKRDEACGHLQAMLVLNPNDNQGVRYILAAWLFEISEDDELAKLLDIYAEDYMAAWKWSYALLAFRRSGDKKESRAQLAAAIKTNRHIPAYLLGKTPLPKKLPPFISPGEKDEAIHYVAEFAEGWRQTPGAVDWLKTQCKQSQSRKGTRRAA